LLRKYCKERVFVVIHFFGTPHKKKKGKTENIKKSKEILEENKKKYQQEEYTRTPKESPKIG
jgi:hypothetical protein